MTPTGQVSLTDGGVVVSTATLDANGNAQITYTATGVAEHAVSAAYAGDNNTLPSTGNIIWETVMPGRVGSVTTVKTSPNPAKEGDVVTVSISVAPAS